MVTWKRFAYVETGGASDLMTISDIPATAKYIRLLIEIKRTANMDNVSFRFNGNTENKYTWRYDKNSDSGGDQANYNYLRFWLQGATDGFSVVDITNVVNKEKLVMSNSVQQESSGNSEMKNTQMIGKWIDDSLIETITIHQFAGSADFADGTSVTVLIPDEGTTVYNYPNLPNGTIFNEVDTYKYFMWNSSAETWHQMVSS